MTTYPREDNVKLHDVAINNKVNIAEPEKIQLVESNLKTLNPTAIVIKASSEVTVHKPELVRGKRDLIIEDDPTVTHGAIAYRVGYVAANSFHAKEIVDPRDYAAGLKK